MLQRNVNKDLAPTAVVWVLLKQQFSFNSSQRHQRQRKRPLLHYSGKERQRCIHWQWFTLDYISIGMRLWQWSPNIESMRLKVLNIQEWNVNRSAHTYISISILHISIGSETLTVIPVHVQCINEGKGDNREGEVHLGNTIYITISKWQ